MVCPPCLAAAASTGPVAPITLAATGAYVLLNNKKSKKRKYTNTKRKLKKRKSKKRKSKRKNMQK